MEKRLFLTLISLFFILCIPAQQVNPVAFTLNGKPVYKSEVESAYKKGNESMQSHTPIENFIQSYIEFKMNVEEARAEHLDTTANYIRQFNSYRMQLGAPYLKDTISENEYVKKIYNRLQEDIEVNHIILPFSKEIIFPADTMPVYKKAIEARTKILQEGFTDGILNIEQSESNIIWGAEGKNGYLGWIAPFMLSAKLEDAVYSLPIGEISMPIRTASGYHIVQVLGRRPSIGSAEIEQVMFRFNQIPAPKHQMDSVRRVAMKEYEKLHNSHNFESLCEAFSKAYKTGEKGCYFGIVGLDSNLSPEFLYAVFNLKELGDISKPVMTEYGFHIIRLLNKIPLPSFEKLEGKIRDKIRNGNRTYELNKEKKLRLINTVNIQINEAAYTRLNNIAINISPRDSSFLKHIKNQEEQLVTIDNKRNVPVKEFVRYMGYRQKLLQNETDELEMLNAMEASPYSLSTDILKEYFDNFLTILATDYLDDILEEKHPEFRTLMNEFSDDLLLFEVKNKNIWERAKNDDAGLASYFAKNKSNYKFDQPHYKGFIIYAKDQEILSKAEALAKKEKTRENFIQKIRNTINKDSILIKIEPGVWIKGDNPYVDYKIYGDNHPPVYNGFPYFTVSGKFIKQPEEYQDVRAEVELDYQNKLEKDWISYLRNKYKIDINKSVVETIE